MKSGNLNFLEPSGPLQSCNGTALPFYQHVEISSTGNERRSDPHAARNLQHINLTKNIRGYYTPTMIYIS